jgi:hypothetical protein
MKFNSYDIYIRAAGSEDDLFTIMLYVHSQPQYFPKYEQVSRYDPNIENIGPMVTLPEKIDDSEGHMIYGYPAGNPGTDSSQSDGVAFKYYPSAQPKDEDLEGLYEVTGDSFGAAMEDSRVIPLVQEIVKTIHTSGPGI